MEFGVFHILGAFFSGLLSGMILGRLLDDKKDKED